jgi:hypothetical protein
MSERTVCHRSPPAAENARAVEDWNRCNPIGSPVAVRLDAGPIRLTRTLSRAFLTHRGNPAVFVRGVAGYTSLHGVSPVDDADAQSLGVAFPDDDDDCEEA